MILIVFLTWELATVPWQFLKINYSETKHKAKNLKAKLAFISTYLRMIIVICESIKTRPQNTSTLINQKCLYFLFKYLLLFIIIILGLPSER